MSRLLLTTAAITLTSTAAFAGPVHVPAPPPPVVIPVDEPFEGFYIGAELGFVFGDGEESFDQPGTVDGDIDIEFDTGTAYGLFAGYNVQNGSTIFGGEIRALHFSAYIDTEDDGFEVESVIDLRGRVGFGLGSALSYGAAGYSFGTMVLGGPSIDIDGFNVGGGVEYNVSESFFVRGDITFREMSGDTGFGSTIDQAVNTVTIGAGFRF